MKKFIAVFLAALLATGSAFANSVERFQAGRDYQVIEAGKQNPASKLEVVEFFSYLCPHCRHFEPEISKWHAKQSKDVSFVRVPATFMNGWDVAASAYFAGEQLKITDKTHSAIFAALPKMKKFNAEEFAEVMAQASGVPADKIVKTMQGFNVSNKVAAAEKFMLKNSINGVPALLINGKYLATMQANVLEVVDFLLAKERALNNN